MEILKKKTPVEPLPPKASSQQQQTYPVILQKLRIILLNRSGRCRSRCIGRLGCPWLLSRLSFPALVIRVTLLSVTSGFGGTRRHQVIILFNRGGRGRSWCVGRLGCPWLLSCLSFLVLLIRNTLSPVTGSFGGTRHYQIIIPVNTLGSRPPD